MMNNRNMRKIILLLFMIVAPSLAKPLYFGLGPSYGCYRTGDSGGWNDRIGVGSRLRYRWWGADVEVHYKNERYFNDLVWVRSWPLTVSLLAFPFKFAYAGGGFGTYELYVDYNQSIPGLENLQNASRRRAGFHLCAGVEANMTKTSAVTVEMRYSWIDYRLAPLPDVSSVDTNALSLNATVYFKLGVEP
jgi:opacity protein-like surface antigen